MNAISGLMIMAICGGAIIPPLMGWITALSNNVLGMAVIIVCMTCLLAVSLYVHKQTLLSD